MTGKGQEVSTISTHMKKDVDGKITLPDIPKDKEYEHYVAALLQCGGYYLERNITKREEGTELLELDIVSKKIDENGVKKTLIEVKSGGWGMPDIFKVRGWMDYLKITHGAFVVQNKKDDGDGSFEKRQSAARQIDVELISNVLPDNKELLEAFQIENEKIDSLQLKTFQYSYAVEAEMEKMLDDRCKSNPTEGLKALRQFLFEVKNNSFFHRDAKSRVEDLLNTYAKNRNITARLACELKGKEFSSISEDIAIPEDKYKELFYKAEKTDILYTALYAEYIARLTMLNTCIEELMDKPNNELEELLLSLHHDILPQNIKNGMDVLKTHPYVKQYPYFWQVFTYLFGGFVLLDRKDEEYELLSELASIPINEIDNALSVFDILFPMNNGGRWFRQLSESKIKYMQFFPIPLCGIGANFWRMKMGIKDSNYSKMKPNIQGLNTTKDLQKWNNLAYKYVLKYVEESK